MTASPAGALWLFKDEEWQPLRDGLLAGTWPEYASAEVNGQLKRLVVGAACEITITQKGNLCIPEHLIDFAAIDHKLLWVAKPKVVELWRPSRFHRQQLHS